MSKYEFIEAEKANHSVRLLCRTVGAARSGFYNWMAQRDERSSKDLALRVHIRALSRESKGRYGSPRITRALRDKEILVNHKRVARVMRQEGIVGRPRPKFRATTDSNHSKPIADNLLNRRFTAESPNQAWVGDITYLRLVNGWAYLAVLIDLYSRKVVGWSLSGHMKASLCVSALRTAHETRKPEPGLIHHSDRGSQYASDSYRLELAKIDAVQSMSRKGNCWDNAVAESFFGTLKQELVGDRTWSSVADARHDVGHYIDEFYNRKRLHSANDYRSPAQAEAEYWASARGKVA